MKRRLCSLHSLFCLRYVEVGGGNMNVTYKIEKYAHKFNLQADRIDKYTIKLHSPKYAFDSWLVILEDKKLKLMHLSKKKFNQKCSYHLQREICAKNWVWILESVNSHNKYTITRKWNARENLVDRVMRNYKEGKYEQITRAI